MSVNHDYRLTKPDSNLDLGFMTTSKHTAFEWENIMSARTYGDLSL